MLRGLPIIFISILFSFKCFGQLVVYSNGKEVNVNSKDITYSIKEGVHISDSALQNQQHNWVSLNSTQLSLKENQETIWYKIPMNSFINDNATDYVEIREPNINYLQVWISKNGTIVKRFERTGDNTEFSTRPIPTSTFIFPIEGNKYRDCELIIATDKRHSRYFIPVFFNSADQFKKDAVEKDIKLGLFLISTLLLILVQVFIFIKSKYQWAKWSTIYLCLLLIFILADNAILFRYIYPHQPYVNDVIRPLILSSSFLPFLLFLTSILDLKKNAPKFYLLNKIIKWIFIYVLVIAALTTYRSNFFLQGYWVSTSRIITPICVCMIFIEAVYCWYDKIKYSGWILLISFCGFYQLMIYILFQYISLPYNLNVAESFYYRFGVELFFMGVISFSAYRSMIAKYSSKT